MNIKMPRPNLASISINNNSRFDSDIYYSEIDLCSLY